MSTSSITYDFGTTTLGALLVAHSPRGVCYISLGETDTHNLARCFPNSPLIPSPHPHTIAQIANFIADPSVPIDIPLDVSGTAFQQQVWSVLCSILPGDTMTYSQVAAAINHPRAARAVARACAANKLAIAIPCHRVVAANGISGYRWGVPIKHELLRTESLVSKYL